MIRVLLAMFSNILLCLIYYGVLHTINLYYPTQHWDIYVGIVFRISLALLFITLLLIMLVILYLKSNKLQMLPIIFPIAYWLSFYSVFPFRSLVFTFLSVGLCFVYFWLLKKKIFVHIIKS